MSLIIIIIIFRRSSFQAVAGSHHSTTHAQSVSHHMYECANASLIKPLTKPVKVNNLAFLVCSHEVLSQYLGGRWHWRTPWSSLFFLLDLKIAVILLSWWARFDVRFQSLPYSLSLPCAGGDAMLLSRVSDHSCHEACLQTGCAHINTITLEWILLMSYQNITIITILAEVKTSWAY